MGVAEHVVEFLAEAMLRFSATLFHDALEMHAGGETAHGNLTLASRAWLAALRGMSRARLLEQNQFYERSATASKNYIKLYPDHKRAARDLGWLGCTLLASLDYYHIALLLF